MNLPNFDDEPTKPSFRPVDLPQPFELRRPVKAVQVDWLKPPGWRERLAGWWCRLRYRVALWLDRLAQRVSP